MIDNYYNGVIEQVYNRLGRSEKNIVMAAYNNDFSIWHLDKIKEYSESEEDIFFAWEDYRHGILPGAYEPFLDTICAMYRKYGNGYFADFLEECGVYELQRPVLLSYYQTGVCEREEHVLLNEVEYEQECMTEAVANMLRKISEEHPVMIVINRFQKASVSTMRLVLDLIEKPSIYIGLVLGVNETQPKNEDAEQVWNQILERLEDGSQLYHIGSSGKRRTDNSIPYRREDDDYAKELVKVHNMYSLMDYEQARLYFQKVEHQIKFEGVHIGDETKLKLYLLYAKNSILLGDMAKALEMLAEVGRLNSEEKARGIDSECDYLMATCYMYQGKLDLAQTYAKRALDEAVAGQDEMRAFKCELLMVQAQMSGWYNIFFCVQDIPIDEDLIEKMVKYNYRNHLAHVYIYAYDNRPEMVAKAYRSEAALFYFSKGVALAMEIGNNELVFDAYQKNTMIASTNGMNEIALLYMVRTYQLDWCRNRYEGRLLTGIGYNLSALGHNAEAQMYYDRAIELLYKLRMPEEIAEVYYNHSLNNIMQEEYSRAEHDLQIAMKVIEKLHLNSLRVCNLSKLYGLLALSCILQGDRFGCERYLFSCRQFLNYIIEKEKVSDAEVIHDYAKCDDDMFLYTFSTALLEELGGDDEQAFAHMEEAEKFLKNAEGNQFFAHRIFRKKRMELFERMGRTELYQIEKHTLEQREEMDRQLWASVNMDLLEAVDFGDYDGNCRVSEEEIDTLIKQVGISKDYQNIRGQMDFISAWQKLIDNSEGDIQELVSTAVGALANRLSLDCSVYVRYSGGQARVLYNDTGVDMTEEVLETVSRSMKEYPQGFAVSKIRESFFEHQDVISIFGVNEVCSFVAVPFIKNGELTSLLLTYVRMKDNWHGYIERYLLGEDELHICQLLFRELEYSINRMEANEKIREMNSKLQAAAVTDVLTSIYNRAGMYDRVHQMAAELERTHSSRALGLMFIDLDNFKHYNDTYGHDIGDLILKEMAAIFRKVSEGKGFVSRYGGDEFIVILDTCDKGELEAIAKEIYALIGATNGFKKQIEDYLGREIEVDKSRLITCSIGIAMAPAVHGEEEVNELIRMADDKLYSVKTGQKGHYAFI